MLSRDPLELGLYHPATEPPPPGHPDCPPTKPLISVKFLPIFGRFWSFSTVFGQFWPKTQEKASAEIRGEFFRTNSDLNFAGACWVDFFGPFSLEKELGKNPPKNPRQNSNRNLGASRQKSTLPRSCLDKNGQNRLEIGSSKRACSMCLAVGGRGCVAGSQVTTLDPHPNTPAFLALSFYLEFRHLKGADNNNPTTWCELSVSLSLSLSLPLWQSWRFQSWQLPP